MAANAGALVFCSRHGSRGQCWINFDGTHVAADRCVCLVAGVEGWECPIDFHAQRWRNENPQHGRAFVRPIRAGRIQAELNAATQSDLFQQQTARRLGVQASERKAELAQHYTRNTLEVSAWCAKCRKNTMHRVDGVRKGPCKLCIERLETAPKPAPTPKQQHLF